ncbi:MAG: VOC family protein [Proteobacteria bacterium]|nr:VOC family protein [Pseudomonadota bacterium]
MSSYQGPMKVKRISEVGVAVRSIEKSTRLFVELLGAEAGPIVDMPLYSMRFRMCRVGKVDFELMEPVGDEGVIAKFLKTRGEGLHHVAFAVDELAEGMSSLQRQGVRFVADEPLEGHGDCVDYAGRPVSGRSRFIFSIPADISGILFEFIEYPEDYQTP